MRILFLSRWFPYPPDNGSKIRIFNLIKQLAAKHQVVLISFANDLPPSTAIAALRPYCDQIHTVAYRPFQPTRLRAVAALLSPRPRSVVDTYNQEMAHTVASVAENFQPDLVIASEIDMAPYALAVQKAKRILDEIQLTVLYEAVNQGKHNIARLRRLLTWQKHFRYVATTLKRFDGCTVVSEQEYQQVKRIAHHATPIKIVPNGVDLAQMRGDFDEPKLDTLIYTGALTFDANLDAMHYFVQEIFPRIVAANPATTLKITGKITGIAANALPVHPNLTLTGYLADIRPTIAQSYLSVVPLRIGGGTRLKILESLALGTPVITTSKGVEGLKLAPGAGIMIADTPDAFANAILTLQRHPELRQQLSLAGRAAVQSYDWQHVGESLHALIDAIMHPRAERQVRIAA